LAAGSRKNFDTIGKTMSTHAGRKKNGARAALIALPALWLVVFFLIPFVMVLAISFSSPSLSVPPFEYLIAYGEGMVNIKINLKNFITIFVNNSYLNAALTSLKIAAVSTILTLLIAYPLSYAIANCSEKYRSLFIFLIIIPFWSSMLIRVYAWMSILRGNGLLNNFLLWLGVIDSPLRILNTETAIYIGIVYTYLPFMVLPLYASLSATDRSLIEAARDLGCSRLTAFWQITIRLSVPGIVAGCALVFIPAIGEAVIPDLLGGADTNTLGRSIWLEFSSNRDWPQTAAVTVVILALLIVPISLYQYYRSRQLEGDEA